MSVAICILAKDEAKSISNILAALARQTVIAEARSSIAIHVVANGCTDDTAHVARSHTSLFNGERVRLHIHDLHPGGKSRAWNRTVHELVDRNIELLVFMDADITLVDEHVITDMIATLEADDAAMICCGYPIKDVSVKARKTLLDRFSLTISRWTRHVAAISGQLYAARGDCLRKIWLPDDTPGEDGFLNAMVTTDGFTMPADGSKIVPASCPTHFYEAHAPFEFLMHERRMIVGTMVNRWIFEHLWSLRLSDHAGRLIHSWNKADPSWVERLVQQRAAQSSWLVPKAIMFGRLKKRESMLKNIVFFPLALAATILTIPPAVAANRRLKRPGAARTW